MNMPEVNFDREGNIIPEKRYAGWDKGKLAVLSVFALYFLNLALTYKAEWCILDGMNIWIHEAGHFIFMLFGSEFMTIAGGTLMQLLVPAAFVAYFVFSEQELSAAITACWLGESFLNVSVYMADATDMVLPLIGGGGPESHDWHNMFSMLGVLPHTQSLAGLTRLLGVAIICAAIGWGIRCCRKEEEVTISGPAEA